MKLITTAELLELIRAIKGATFATLTLSTEPTMRKTDNPFYGLVKKVAIHNVCLNYNYENSVNKQRDREDKIENGPFVAAETWGSHETSAVVEHKGIHYLQVKLQKTLSTLFVHTIDNSPVDVAELAPFMPEKKANKSQGVDEQILNIRPKFDNIIAISIKGQDYQVVR